MPDTPKVDVVKEARELRWSDDVPPRLTTMPTEQILTIEQIVELHSRAVGGPLLLPLRVEHWHWGTGGGGWYVRHSTGRILMTVEFVEAEIASGKPALDGNAPARAVVDLLNAVPALCNTVRARTEQHQRLLTGLLNIYHMITGERCDPLVALGMATSAVSSLQSRLSEVEKEREEALCEASQQSALADDYACDLTDAERKFERVINLCKEKAAEWELEAIAESERNPDLSRDSASRAIAVNELREAIENLDHKE